MVFNKPETAAWTGRIPKSRGETFEAPPEAAKVSVSTLSSCGPDSVARAADHARYFSEPHQEDVPVSTTFLLNNGL